jgi:hypothetical protein
MRTATRRWPSQPGIEGLKNFNKSLQNHPANARMIRLPSRNRQRTIASMRSAAGERATGSMPGVIGMSLQNRERAINLLQQNHSRQFMRQGHLS